jgi:predicted transcriptional regulator of viral defense system
MTRKDPFRRLYEIAEAQHGFFTAKQAAAAGVARGLHGYHVKVGNWVRQRHGIYRLSVIPPTKNANLTLWQLWSANRTGQAEGVYSHQTALRLHGFELNPAKVHITVPARFRRTSPTPQELRLYYADLPPTDIVLRQGYPTTAALRTILDLAAASTLAQDTLRHALLTFIEQQQISRDDVNRAQIPARLRALFFQLRSEIHHR